MSKKTYIINKKKHIIGEEVTKENVFGGIYVIDNDGLIGIITHNDNDCHNVIVKYNGGGQGVYCLNKNCFEVKEVDGHLAIVKLYEPLYYLTPIK